MGYFYLYLQHILGASKSGKLYNPLGGSPGLDDWFLSLSLSSSPYLLFYLEIIVSVDPKPLRGVQELMAGHRVQLSALLAHAEPGRYWIKLDIGDGFFRTFHTKTL